MSACRKCAWLAVLALGAGMAPAGAAAQRPAPHVRARLNPGSDLWFAGLFQLASPVEGGQLGFLNTHLSFTEGSFRFGIPIPAALIVYTTIDTAQSVEPGGGRWLSHFPFSFNEQWFVSGMSWDPAANLPGAVLQTRSGNLFITVGAPRLRKPSRPR